MICVTLQKRMDLNVGNAWSTTLAAFRYRLKQQITIISYGKNSAPTIYFFHLTSSKECMISLVSVKKQALDGTSTQV